jgi:hypothetical protein
VTVFRDSLSRVNINRLADLHVKTLPRSLISLLGRGYARSFYHYLIQHQGWGSRALSLCELALRERGAVSYTLKSEQKPCNRALHFYARRDFHPAGVYYHHGQLFHVFQKSLPVTDERAQ